jgi:Flp pilus assembly protein TadG
LKLNPFGIAYRIYPAIVAPSGRLSFAERLGHNSMKCSLRFGFAFRLLQPSSRNLRGDRGSALFELALSLPILAILLVGIIKSGILFYDYITLADAVAVGARTLATSRGVSTACTSAETAVTNAATDLVASKITPTVSFPSSNTHSDSCTTLYPGDAVEVQATYPCDLTIPFLGNVWPGCTLTSETAVRIE